MSPTQRRARLAGALYAAMGMTGAYTLLVLPRHFIVPNDAAATAAAITAGASVYRAGVLVDLLTSVFAIWMAVILFEMFEDVNRTHARLMAGFVLGMAAVGLGATLAMAAPLAVLTEGGRFAAFDAGQRDALVLLFWTLRVQAIRVATMYWGVWLLPLGALVRQSGFLPRALGTLILIAGWSYVLSAAVYFAIPQIGSMVANVAMLPQGLGEASFVGWLLIRGVREPGS